MRLALLIYHFFGKSAEIANQYLNKGSKLLIEGRLKFDQWTDNNGQNRSKHSIVVESMEMLGSNNQTQQGGYSMNSQNSGGYGATRWITKTTNITSPARS